MALTRYVRTGSLSFCQELLLFSEILQGCAPIISRLVRISGPIDVSAFATAAQATVAAHEPLRSVCIWRSGEPVCEVLAPNDVEESCWYDDVTLGKSVKSALEAAYDPACFAAARAPKMRHCLVRVEEDVHLWAFGVHHIAADAISLVHYAETFRQRYSGVPSTLLPTTSIDHAQAQRKWLASAEAQSQYEWWLRRLDSVGSETLPVRAPTSPSVLGQYRQELRLAVGGRKAVVRRAREWRVPVAALFLAAFARIVAMRRLASAVTVFTNVPGRSLTGAGTATGAFYNTVPLAMWAQGGDARSASTTTAEALFEVLDHQEVPIALLSLGAARRSSVSLSTRIPITFNVLEHPLSSFRLPGCSLHDVDIATLGPVTWTSGGAMSLQGVRDPGRGPMDWLVTILPSALVIAVEYDAGQCDGCDVRAMLDSYAMELRSFLDSDFGDEKGDPSLVADWSST